MIPHPFSVKRITFFSNELVVELISIEVPFWEKVSARFDLQASWMVSAQLNFYFLSLLMYRVFVWIPAEGRPPYKSCGRRWRSFQLWSGDAADQVCLSGTGLALHLLFSPPSVTSIFPSLGPALVAQLQLRWQVKLTGTCPLLKNEKKYLKEV